MKFSKLYILPGILTVIAAAMISCTTQQTGEQPLGKSCGSKAGKVLDEAQCAGRSAESFPAADEDYFQDMDYGVSKDPAAVAAALDPYIPGITPEDAVKAIVKGRNNWIVWTGGNDRMWDELSRASVGTLDFLKTISNHPSLNLSLIHI